MEKSSKIADLRYNNNLILNWKCKTKKLITWIPEGLTLTREHPSRGSGDQSNLPSVAIQHEKFALNKSGLDPNSKPDHRNLKPRRKSYAPDHGQNPKAKNFKIDASTFQLDYEASNKERQKNFSAFK